MKFKEMGVIAILAIVVIGIITGIYLIKGNGNVDEDVLKCIAQKSKVFVSPTCPACAGQKQILGDNFEDFEIINIYDPANDEEVKKYDFSHIPAWVINEKVFEGVKTIEELKELSGC
jgi:glutaredoxin